MADVTANSPAAKAGVQSGDVILEYNGKEIHSANDLSLSVADTKVGEPANLKVLRDGKEVTLQVHVGEKPADVAQAFQSSGSQERGKLGLAVENITPEVAREMHLSSTVGALVTEVKPGSPADEAGVRPGDVIKGVNHANVANAAELVAATRSLKSGDTVRLRLVRDGQVLFVAFELS